MKHEQGSVTIMLCILFLFLLCLGVLIDSAVCCGGSTGERAARTAINSVLSNMM